MIRFTLNYINIAIGAFFCFFKLYFYCWHYSRGPLISPICPPPPSPHPSSLWPSPHCCLCLWVMHICSLASPFAFFHPVLPSPPLTAVGLLHVPMPPFLPCLSVYFVHSIPHISEILWYLSSNDWLISFSTVISRGIHARWGLALW